MKSITKRLWVWFTETLGATIIHPQSLLIRFQDEIINETKKYAKGKLVDIGCGRMPYRKKLEPVVTSYIGVDHPEVSKLYQRVQPEVLADAKKLPFPNSSFDTALLLQVLEHVDTPNEVIKEATRVLKPNGILIISVPFLYPLHDMPHDFGRYTESALKDFINSAGLRVVKMKIQGGFFEFWLQMLNTFLVKRINDMILTKFNFLSISFLILIIIFSLPVILMDNLLIIIIGFSSRALPKYPNYFPIYYFFVARKKR